MDNIVLTVQEFLELSITEIDGREYLWQDGTLWAFPEKEKENLIQWLETEFILKEDEEGKNCPAWPDYLEETTIEKITG